MGQCKSKSLNTVLENGGGSNRSAEERERANNERNRAAEERERAAFRARRQAQCNLVQLQDVISLLEEYGGMA